MKLFKYDEEKLSYKLLFYGKTHRMVWLLLFVLSLLLYLTFRVGHYFGDVDVSIIPKHQNNTIQYEKELFVIDTLDVFSEKNLVTYLLELNIKFPDIVFSQARYETGNFKSLVFRENSNLFGMKVANSRATTNKGEQHNHAIFDNWQMSVLDYALWQNAYGRKFKTRESYMQYLKDVYAEGTYESINKILLETQSKYPKLKVTYPFRN
tara:strand:+ start:1522 stop:2145 length:624 start_codon:yes stop_codon:yes gene_type:complete